MYTSFRKTASSLYSRGKSRGVHMAKPKQQPKAAAAPTANKRAAAASSSTSSLPTKKKSKATPATTTTTTNPALLPTPLSGRIDEAQARKAVQALMTHHAKHMASLAAKKGGKQDLLASESGDFILVQLALAKIPERVSPKPVPIRLPHPLHGAADAEEEHGICIIVKEADKGKVQKALAAMKLEGVSEVVGLQELRTDYKEFQERRKLRDAFDLFLADERILPMLSKALGKTFFSKKKHPVPVNIGGLLSNNPAHMATVGKRIIAAQQRTHLYRNHGSCVAVKVAKTSFPPTHVLANVLAGVEGAVQVLPGKWKNIMAVSIKTSRSVALPIYQRLPQYLVKKPLALEGDAALLQQLKDEEEMEQKKSLGKGGKKRALEEEEGVAVVAEKKTASKKKKVNSVDGGESKTTAAALGGGEKKETKRGRDEVAAAESSSSKKKTVAVGVKSKGEKKPQLKKKVKA